MKIKEIQIAVPWGHIASKTWGDHKNSLILLFHGFGDNAGTFDRLIPHLPQNFYYVCIDLPGHGKSSYFPPFFPYFTINFVLVYQLIMNYFGRKGYTIIAHSYGGQIAILFTLLYPERIEKLVLLDCIHLFPSPAKIYLQTLRIKLNHILKLHKLANENLVPAPTYYYEQTMEKIQNGRIKFCGVPMAKESAKAILSRGLTKVNEYKYRFNMDQRLKSFLNPSNDLDYMADVIEKNPIKCPLLIVFGSLTDFQRDKMAKILDLYKKKENFQSEFVYGGHDIHSDSPEIVGPIVSKFLLIYKSKL